MSYMPVRGGTRGGKDQFQWEDVKADKHRENYLGHSLMAPVGRWQKGKDLTWYNKKSKVAGQKEILRAEIAAVKRAEEDAMAAALGLKPKGASLGSGSVSKQELAEVCRRQSVEEKEETGEERMQGLGFASHRFSHLYSNQASATGAAMFESNPVHEGDSTGVSAVNTQPSHPPPPPSSSPPTKQARLDRKLIWVEKTSDVSSKHHSKDKKKKKKKEKSKKKHKDRKRRHDSSSSESEDETSRKWVQRKNRSDPEERGSRHQRYKEHNSSDSAEERSRRRESDEDDRGRREERRYHSGKESTREGGRRGRRQKEQDQERWRKPQRSRHQRHDSSSD